MINMAISDTLSRRIKATKDVSDNEDLVATQSNFSTQQPLNAAEVDDSSSNEGSVSGSQVDYPFQAFSVPI